MRRSRISVLIGIGLLAFLVSGVSSQRPQRKSARLKVLEQPALRQGPAMSAAAPLKDAVLMAEYSFDNAGPDPQGWLGEDVYAVRDTFFHVDDFAGLGPAYTPIGGSKSLWCGTADSERFPNWEALPGYGDNWDQYFESVAFPTSGDVTLQFAMRYDCEAGEDFVTVQFKDKNGQWQDWASYTGTGTTTFNSTLSEDTLDGSAGFRIRFDADPVYSDEDGLYDSDGAVIIDDITVSDQTGTLNTQDFESDDVGDHLTADGNWQAHGPVGFGNYSGLVDGTDVLQEDPLVTNSTHLWSFFNGSTDTYACGGHPEQDAVPLRVGDGGGQAIDNRIHSPWIDLSKDIGGNTLPFSPEYVVLDFDAYMENPPDNAVFFQYQVRYLVGGSSTDWVDDNWAYYWPGTPQWMPLQFTHPVSSGATHVQVAIRVLEIALYGSGMCHSHAPLFDNVSVSGLENSVGVVITTADSGPGSLRQAILDANAFPDTSVIEFSINGIVQKTIRPQTPLPAITEPVVIDGYTQNGSSPNTSPPGAAGNAALRVTLDGDALGAGATNHGLILNADNCTIRGLAINRFGGSAIYCPNSDGHVIEGNYIGTDISGTIDMGNGGPYAVYLLDGDSTTIGGTSPAARNVISGNDSAAIYISGDGNVVQGNLIGTDATGAVAMGNDEGGIYIRGTGNTIGGITAAARNVIAANGVGSTNHRYGIEIKSPGANNIVQGNYIGTDITGTVGMGNKNGIALDASAGNIIGGTVPGAGNVISAQGVGIGIWWSGSSNNLVQGNYIGTDASGIAPLGNDGEGIRVWGASNNTIGGTEAGAGNIVAFTVSGSGISVHEAISSGNAILSNSIFSNGDIGLGLGPWDGVTMNDSADVDTGPNGFQNFPVLTAVTAGSIQIEGTLNSTPDTQFRLEFFSNTACDPTGYGEGETFIGSTSVTTDVMGDGSFTANFSEAVAPGSFVTATATAPNGSTSEFCECVVVDCAPVLYVDADAAGAADGSSWTDAFTDLQDALAAVSLLPCSDQKIWVAAGTYMPTDATDRSATFQLQDSVAIYGGFAGTETLLSERDWAANVTILSGDLGIVDDDSDDSYHVVTASGTNSSAVVDGLSILNGNANGGGQDDFGGGIYNAGGSPTIQNVWLHSHGAAAGGSAMYNSGGSPLIRNTIIFDKITNHNGSAPVITNSAIVLSKIVNVDSSPLIYNTIIWTSGAGPVVENTGTSSPSFANSLVMGSGGSSSWGAGFGNDLGNNIDADPMFKDASSGDVRLWSSSPVIDAGDSTFVPPGMTRDIANYPRNYGGEVDMGAYEYQGSPTGIDGDPAKVIPKVTALRSVYPNPFNPTVTVEFDLDRRRNVQMAIYDVGGRLVRRLLNEDRSSGTHRVRWNGRDDAGSSVATGVYFLQVRSEGWSVQRKIVLLK